MKRVYLAFAAAAACLCAAPANAALTLVDHGITYQLDLDSITNGGLTGNYTLAISGVNTASDTEGGRTGIHAFAFNDASFVTGGTSTGFTFQLGGLNSSGCDGAGNGFFCFNNTSAVFASPLPSSGSILFSITSATTGNFATWTPDFKIDWVGSKNNYDLVSKPIPLNNCTASPGCPTPTPFDTPPVPEPATWAMMLLGFSGIGMAMQRKNRSGKLLQIA
jgi:hypothetical protein